MPGVRGRQKTKAKRPALALPCRTRQIGACCIMCVSNVARQYPAQHNKIFSSWIPFSFSVSLCWQQTMWVMRHQKWVSNRAEAEKPCLALAVAFRTVTHIFYSVLFNFSNYDLFLFNAGAKLFFMFESLKWAWICRQAIAKVVFKGIRPKMLFILPSEYPTLVVIQRWPLVFVWKLVKCHAYSKRQWNVGLKFLKFSHSFPS
jgi:hypothetical protein